MGVKNLIFGLRLRWYLPPLVAGIALTSQQLWEHFSDGPYYRSAVLIETKPSAVRFEPSVEEAIRAVAGVTRPIPVTLFEEAASILRGALSPQEAGPEGPDPSREEIGGYGGAFPKGIGYRELVERLRRGVRVRRLPQREAVEVTARSTSAAESRATSAGMAVAIERHLQNEIQNRSREELRQLRGQESNLDKQWKSAIQDYLDSTAQIGAVDLDRHEKTIQRLVEETEVELSQSEIRRMELASTIQARESARVTTTSESIEGDAHLSESEVKKIQQELLQARLEYQVQSTTVSRSHPKMARLRERIKELEARALEATVVQPGPPSKVAERTEELVAEYRVLSLKLDALKRKLQSLSQKLRSLREFRPQIEKAEWHLAGLKKRLEIVRGRIDELESFSADGSAHFQARTRRETVESTQAGVGLAWQAGSILGGLLVGVLMTWFLTLRDPKLRGEHDVHQILQLPILAKIPRMSPMECMDLEANARRSVQESFKIAATVVKTVARELGLKVFSISSANDGDGKSTVAVHLAVALAKKGFKVALVDADFQKPTLHSSLGLANELGLTSLLTSEHLDEEVVEDDSVVDEVRQLDPNEPESVETVLQRAIFENLYVMTSGPSCEVYPEFAAGCQAMEDVLNTLREMMDYVLIDTPAIRSGGEALELVGLSDCCVMVVAAGESDYRDALWAKQLCENVQTSIAGVFLNRRSGRSDSSRGSYGREGSSQESTVEVGA